MAQVAPLHHPSKRFLVPASIFLALHGVIEVLSVIKIFVPVGFLFAFNELNQSYQATMLVGVVFGLLRISAALGILKNRMWGWILGMVMSIVTLAMLTFYLPAGVLDAVLAGAALVTLLIGRYPEARINS